MIRFNVWMPPLAELLLGRAGVMGMVVAVIFILYKKAGRAVRRVLVALGGVGVVLCAGRLIWFGVTSPARDHDE